MRSTLRAVGLVTVVSLLAWSLQALLVAADGVLVSEKTTTAGRTETHQIQIERNRMRAEVTGPTGEVQAVIFDGAKQTMWILNLDKKTYSEITKADMDQVAGQMSAAMAQMQEMMRGMPPEQRAQMEAMMRGRGMPGMGAAPPQTEYRKAGTDRVGRWTCEKYDGYQNNQKTSEVCTIDPKELGFVAADFEVSRQMADFFSKLVPQGADNFFKVGGAEPQGFSGVPVRRLTSIGGRQIISEVTDAVRQTFPDSTFAVPAGFQKEASPFGGRGR
ncbi:MAG: hypothetical protein A3G76_07795 [Acidobacteria bacterium RIFCSPLOWO2_12_FULL_65_11]|nr:MAG: hypothetical protein A3H95_01100 [Acidobacteria bacterium RIFCSPLOWO2_02_FULL_64_15]OFW31829.1 MAG: hypothetical protein A3G76_07795 [Acidobacteria bacterium RIFCSPLOWO2_12_FULL_65_11]